MTSSKQQRLYFTKRLIISIAVVVAVIVLLAALSYLWLPGYAKSQLEIRLSETLQRQVKVAAIEIKPHTLELIVQDFQVGDKVDGQEKVEPFLSFSQLHIDLSIESLVRRAPVVTTVSLVNPKFRLIRELEDQFNISDLIEKFSQPADKETPESDGMPFSVSNIMIQNGHFEFIDHSANTTQQISEINLAIPIIANLKSSPTDWIEPHFSAKINGSPFLLDGKLRAFTENQEATLAFKFSEFDLTRIEQYAALPKGIRMLSGIYDSDLLLTFTQAPDKAADIILTGKSTLRHLKIKNNTVETPYQATIEQLAIDLKKVDLAGQAPSLVRVDIDQIALLPENDKESVLSLANLTIDQVVVNATEHTVKLDEITVDRLRTILRRDATGTIDLTRLFNSVDTKVTDKLQQGKRAKVILNCCRKNIPIFSNN